MSVDLQALASSLNLDSGESNQLVQILTAAASNIEPGKLDDDPTLSRLLQSISLILTNTLQHCERGIGFKHWFGQLPCIDAQVFAELVKESVEKKFSSMPMSNHKIARGGDVATRILGSAAMAQFIQHTLCEEEILPTEVYYHYYDSPAEFAEFHIDKEDFSINVLIVLTHTWDSSPNSDLYIVPPGEVPMRTNLKVGDAIVFESSGILHCRSAPAMGERLTTMSLGFRKPRHLVHLR